MNVLSVDRCVLCVFASRELLSDIARQDLSPIGKCNHEKASATTYLKVKES
jgi:hypothetical protein